MKIVEFLMFICILLIAFSVGRAYQDFENRKAIEVLADRKNACEEKLDMWRKEASRRGIYGKRYKQAIFRY